MNALVVGAAPQDTEQPFYLGLLNAADLVVGADAAAEWCVALGRVPDIAVGDFDSAAPGAHERLRELGVTVVFRPREKDESDLDLAVAAARAAGAVRIVLTAAYSARLDHTLAALGTLAGCSDLHGEIAEPEVAGWVVDARTRPTLALTGPVGALVSVFAIGGAASGLTLGGFDYPLRSSTLETLSSRGLSNTLADDHATVSVDAGTVLILTSGCPADRAREDILG